MADQQAEEHVRFSDLFAKGRALLTVTLIISVGSHAVNLFATRTVLPTIVDDIGGKELMYWVIALFQITAIVGGVMSSNIKARLGGRHTFYLAAFLLVCGSTIAGFAPIFEIIILGRGIQGFAEGLLISLAYIILGESYKNNLMTRMIGVLAIVWAVAAALGPFFAGTLELAFGWRSTFLVNLIIAALLAVQARFAVAQEPDTGNTQQSANIRLLLLISGISIICLLGQLTQPLQILLTLTLGVGLILVAIKRDRAATNPMLPRKLFSFSGTVGLGFWVTISVSIAMAGHVVFAVALLQSLWQLTPLHAGYLASIVAMTWSAAAWLLSGVNKERIQLYCIRLGASFVSIGLLICAVGIAQNSLLITCSGFVVLGTGMGCKGIFLDKKIINAASANEKDQTSSMLPPVASAAGAVGAAMAAIIALALGLYEGTSSYGIFNAEVAIQVAPQMYLAFFILSLPAMVMTFFMPLYDSKLVAQPAH